MDEAIERDLIGRCRRGEREAFDALMQEHADSVYQLAYRLTASHETADGADRVTIERG